MAESERASASAGHPSSDGLKGSVQVEWSPLSSTRALALMDHVIKFSPVLRGGEADAGPETAEHRQCPTAGPGAVGPREEPAADRNAEGSTSPGRERSPDGHGRGRKTPRKRRRGRRGPERFDADYYLRKLQQEVVEEGRRAGDTEREISESIRRLQQKSSEELAEEVAKRFKVHRDGRTYRRNSRLYREWEPHREAAGGRRPVDRGRQPPKKTPPRTQADLATAAAINGQLSQREVPNGRTHGDREAIDFANDAMADDFLRENGVLGDFEPL
jgi:hypothetical protein